MARLKWHPAWIFVLIALFIAGPLWLHRHVFLGSSDNLYHMYPNLFFTHFALRHGSWGFWNPFILGGIDFTASSHNHLYNVLNWPLFLLPQKYVPAGLSFRFLIEIFLVGYCAFLFLCAETNNRLWSLIGAVIYQAGGFTLFASTTYPAVQLQFLIPAVGYWLWTSEKRSTVWQFLGLCGFFVVILLSMNITYVFVAMLIITTLFLYRYLRHWSGWSEFCRPALIFVNAGFFALALCAWRLLPLINSLFFEGSRLAHARMLITRWRAYLFAQAGLPEMVGVNISESLPIFSALGDAGAHGQFHGFPYLSVFGLHLFLFATFVHRTNKFWLGWSWLAILWFLVVPPFVGVADYFLSPLVHPIIPKFMLPLAIAVTITYSGMALEKALVVDIKRYLRVLWLNFVVLTLFMAAVWFVVLPQAWYRGLWFGMALVSYVIIMKFSERRNLIIGGIISFGLAIGVAQITREHRHISIATFSSNTQYILLTLVLTYLSLGMLLWPPKHWPKWLRLSTVLVLVSSFIFLPQLGELIFGSPAQKFSQDIQSTGIVALLSVVRFFALTLAFAFVLRHFSGPSKQVHVLKTVSVILIFIAVDLFPLAKIFSRQVTNFFQRRATLYPSASMDLKMNVWQHPDGTVLDFSNFRMNNSNQVLEQKPFPLESNIPMLSGTRMIGGLNSDVSGRLMELLRSFYPEHYITSGITTSLRETPFLDLAGVRYDIAEKDKLHLRPGALSRMMFFSQSKIVSTEAEELSVLHQKDWQPLQTVVLEAQSPVANSNDLESNSTPGKMLLNYETLSFEHLRVTVEAPHAGYILFNDSYNKNWHALVNGIDQKIYRANYSFMSVFIPHGGKFVIDFVFKPKLFIFGLKITVITAVLLALVLGVRLGLTSRRSKYVS